MAAKTVNSVAVKVAQLAASTAGAATKSSKLAARTDNMAAEMDNDPNRRSLLDLPPEIWSRICRLAVVQDRIIAAWKASEARELARDVAQPSITRVCKAIRAETLAHYYGENQFDINLRNRYHDLDVFEVRPLAQWINVLLDAGLWRHVRNCRVALTIEVKNVLCHTLPVRLSRYLNRDMKAAVRMQTERMSVGERSFMAPRFYLEVNERAHRRKQWL